MLAFIVTEGTQLVDLQVEIIYVFNLNVHIIKIIIVGVRAQAGQVLLVPPRVHVLFLICLLFCSRDRRNLHYRVWLVVRIIVHFGRDWRAALDSAYPVILARVVLIEFKSWLLVLPQIYQLDLIFEFFLRNALILGVLVDDFLELYVIYNIQRFLFLNNFLRFSNYFDSAILSREFIAPVFLIFETIDVREVLFVNILYDIGVSLSLWPFI